MSTDERNQAGALIAAAVVACLWLSHYVWVFFPNMPGNYNLQLAIKIWNKPLWINWPAAIALFFVGKSWATRIYMEHQASELRKKQKKAQWLADKAKGKSDNKTYRPIL